jgi:2-C-methyl-D-erythritol 4-phosphate cytidylyltransferase/2-C-methyl-D-erythritol 2,4-cyclodiphosphate synthase
VTDALWHGRYSVEGTQPPDNLWRAQTPQGSGFGRLLAAHRAHPGGALDDVEVARLRACPSPIVRGDEDNIKVTHPDDLARACPYPGEPHGCENRQRLRRAMPSAG